MNQDANEKLKKQIEEQVAALQKQAFEIKVEVLGGGKLPFRAHPTDAGFDLFATEEIHLHPGQVKKTPLNIKLELPRSTWASITTKSGLGSQGQLVYAGVIDQAYRGIPHVVMTNVNIIEALDEDGIPLMRIQPIILKVGDKIAQLIMNPYSDQYFITQVESVDTATDRGAGGFGSTGK